MALLEKLTALQESNRSQVRINNRVKGQTKDRHGQFLNKNFTKISKNFSSRQL